MKVLKFGGSSVSTPATIVKVIEIVKNASEKEQIAVVVSAFGGVTDVLLDIAEKASKKDSSYKKQLQQLEERHISTVRELVPVKSQSVVLSTVKSQLNALENIVDGIYLVNELTKKSIDKVVSFGELLSSYIISEACKAKGITTTYKNSQELIVTNENFTNASVLFDQTLPLIKNYFATEKASVTLVPGFVASSKNGEHTTLGRGGSDYTAAIFSAALNASLLEIWTDVSGMFTANPTFVKQAFPLEAISYEEAMELSHFGAKVLYPPTIQPALKSEIPIVIKNTFQPDDAGTYISKESPTENPIRGISHIENIALVTLEGSGMIGVPGISKRLFEALALHNINVALITQASSEHSICIAIHEKEIEVAKSAVENEFAYEIVQQKINPLVVETNQAIVAIVGEKMKSHQGISGKMFSTLGNNNVNIRAIAQGASEKNISAVIAHKDIKKALNTLHSKFFENQVKQLNLFVIGVGNVGAKLLAQIQQQQAYLLDTLKIQLQVVGITNSRNMIFDEEGIPLALWKEKLADGEPANLALFHQKVNDLNLRNSILVDNTASETIAATYESYLKESVAVVTCNKIACSSAFSRYKNLKKLATEYNAPFLFETNVGAGLPIIDTLKNLVSSGDTIHKIQAVLSGSLNFVFNTFSSEIRFIDVVKQAMEEGYTEPDPRIDLSGVDVMRKILILARESGAQMELEDITNESFLPERALQTNSVDDFLTVLAEEDAHFEALRTKAENQELELKYVAQYENGKAKVGLQMLPTNHSFARLEGSDNIVLFYTERYKERPLIVKGAGAGADVTASGLFADIIRIGNK